MTKTTKATLVALTIGLSLAAGSVLYAQNTQAPRDTPTSPDRSHAGSGMMGGDMTGMMAQMRDMMETCNRMMSGSRNQSPATAQPENKG